MIINEPDTGIPGKINSAVAASIAKGATAEQLQPVSDLGVALKSKADAEALDAARHHKASPLLAGVETSITKEKTVDAGTLSLVHGIAGRINTAVVAARANGASAAELQPVADLVYALEADAPVLAAAVVINTSAHPDEANRSEKESSDPATHLEEGAKPVRTETPLADPDKGSRWTSEQRASLDKTRTHK